MRKSFAILFISCLLCGLVVLSGCDKDRSDSQAPGGTEVATGTTGDVYYTNTTVPLEDGKYKVQVYVKETNLLIEEMYYDAQGNQEYRVAYTYNEASQLIELGWYSSDTVIYSAGYYQYDYDESGKLIQKRELNENQNPQAIYDYNADGTTDITTYPRGKFPVFTNNTAENVTRLVTRLDADGKKVCADGYSEQYGHLVRIQFHDDGSGTMETYYTWDNAQEGTVIYVTTFDKDLQLLQETYYHQITGKVISVTDGIFDNNGVLIGKIVREYDVNDKLSSEAEYNINSVILWYKNYESGILQYMEENVLNTDGLIVRMNKTDANNVLIEYIVYEYFESGNCRSEMIYDGDGNFLYGYTYTEDGTSEYIPPNW